MRNRALLRPSHAATLLLVCLSSIGWAQKDALTLENTGAGYVMGGVYTSPYGVSINNSTPVSLICDDFTTDVSLGQSWTATVTSFAQIQAGTSPGGTPKFPVNAIQNYATAAVLSAELMSLPNLDSEAAGDISYALWDVFDPLLLTSPVNPYGWISLTDLNLAKGYLSSAQALVAAATNGQGKVNLSSITVNGSSIAGLTIYTPNPLSSSQEFIQVQMPEPSYPAILALDLLGVIGFIVFWRKRVVRSSNQA